MKKRTYIVIIIFLFVAGIFMGGLLSDETTVNKSDESDIETAYYIEDKSNVFVVVAKTLENGCYYVVNFVFEGIKNVFGSIFGI